MIDCNNSSDTSCDSKECHSIADNLKEIATDKLVSISFICLGNICRSPLAKVIFEGYVQKYYPHLISSFKIHVTHMFK